MTAGPGATSEMRFGFGDNWRQFLALLNEDRIAAAERSHAEDRWVRMDEI